MDRVSAIRERLADHLAPESVEIIDESHKHAGHPGAAAGGGHFHVTIVSGKFKEQSTLQRHRLVYAAVADLMPTEIHALGIKALTPEE